MNHALPEVVSEQEWQKALDAMLVQVKELTRTRTIGIRGPAADADGAGPPYEWRRLHDEYGGG